MGIKFVEDEALRIFAVAEAQAKTTLGQKVDIAFDRMRLALVFGDLELLESTLKKGKLLSPPPHRLNAAA